jgi:hypothetical protein
MSNRKVVDLTLLPSVPLSEKRHLPSETGVYFVIDGDGIVRYVGASLNIKKRFSSHNKAETFRNMGEVVVAYARVEAALLKPVEQLMIHCFKPQLNEVGGYLSGVLFAGSQSRIASPATVDAELYKKFCEKASCQDIKPKKLLEMLVEDRLRRVTKRVIRGKLDCMFLKEGEKTYFSKRVWSKDRFLSQVPVHPARINSRLYGQLEKYSFKVGCYAIQILEDILDEYVNGCAEDIDGGQDA